MATRRECLSTTGLALGGLPLLGRAQALAPPAPPATSGRDFTVKVDVSGLDASTTYYYRFEALGERSQVGRTRTTALAGLGRTRLAVVSCSNLPFGFFNVYARIAARADLDAVVHLGDYIYEYANNNFGICQRIPTRFDSRISPNSHCSRGPAGDVRAAGREGRSGRERRQLGGVPRGALGATSYWISPPLGFRPTGGPCTQLPAACPTSISPRE